MNDDKGIPLRGILSQYYATGVEKECWAFQDDQKKSWDGFRLVKSGDTLTIFSPTDPTQVVWSGILDMHEYIKWFSIGDRRVGSTRSHQLGIDPDVWSEWFNGNYPAELIPKK